MANFAFIGVGSAVFGARTIGDLLFFKEDFAGSTLSLVDTDEKRLGIMKKLSEIMNEQAGSPFRIVANTDRREVLRGADFVITSPAIRREELWKQDWDIIRKLGIKQTYGENGGPGAVALTLRNIPMLLSIFRDVEELAPDAWVINYTNPEARVCIALDRYTDLKFVGLCHQIGEGYRLVSEVLGIAIEDLDIKAGGVNHFTWMYAIHQKSTGSDLYPALRNAAEQGKLDHEPLTLRMLRTFGLCPTPRDHHLAEMLSFAWENQGLKGRDFAAWDKRKKEAMDWANGVVAGSRSVAEVIKGESGERVAHVARSIMKNANAYEISVDLRNDGAIPNLPADSIVEVPAVISATGVAPLRMPPLPEGIAALVRQQIAIQELSVAAAVTGDRSLALQAILLDPCVDSYAAADEALDQLMEANRDTFPAGLYK
ncbi:MAG TPA: alpha-glucosidase/alpha-galactosidase [Spirochaetia bacterium]|nr:alpha-glucosidase/alpha-galactosidase [Spirochaetia bacterium]